MAGAVTQRIVYGSDGSDGNQAVTIGGTDLASAFATAMAALTNGGTIRIFPGTADYELVDNLVIDQDYVTVECVGDVRIKRSAGAWAPSAGNVFVIAKQKHVTWRGGTFTMNAGVDHDNYNIIQSISTAEMDNDFLVVENVDFDFRLGNAGDNDGMRCINWEGSSTTVNAKGLRIYDCNFQMPEDGQNTVRCVLVQNGQGIWIERNWVGVHRSNVAPLVEEQNYRGFIHFVECRFWTVRGNVVRTITGEYFVQAQASTGEGGHGMICDNIIETGGLVDIVRLQGNDFVSVRGNNFGNNDNLQATIALEARTDGGTPRHCMISDNQFHSSDYAAGGYPIHVQNWDGVDIQGNSLYASADDQYFVGVDAASSRVRYNSNTNSVYPVVFNVYAKTRSRNVLYRNPRSVWTEDAYPGTRTW